MTPNVPHYYLARITLEAATPLSIAAGGADGVFDVILVRDANGFPALPGSALAGVLRHLFWDLHDKASMQALFGFQEKDEGEPSRLHVSWGAIQDSQGRPVEGLLPGRDRERLETDALLRAAYEAEAAPVHRDRVRIGHRGAATDTGKFDRAVLPAGYRFSTELSLWSDRADDLRWNQLLDLLAHPVFRLGGAVRAGLGRLRVVRVHSGQFNLRTAEGRRRFAAQSRRLDNTTGLSEVNPGRAGTDTVTRFVIATLKLKPRAFWRIGQGDTPTRRDSEGKPADLLPKLEQRVIWNDNKAEPIAAQLLIPASSVKGAIAHRVAFHANRLAGRWANEMEDLVSYDKSDRCPEVRALFGYARDGKEHAREDERGRAGRVFIDDTFVAFRKEDLQLMMHNAIDRFTGGVREHMLFMEELVWGKGIELQVTIDTGGAPDTARKALRCALQDLCVGRLALGGGAGKGHGFFDGEIQWSDQGAWIEGKARLEAA